MVANREVPFSTAPRSCMLSAGVGGGVCVCVCGGHTHGEQRVSATPRPTSTAGKRNAVGGNVQGKVLEREPAREDALVPDEEQRRFPHDANKGLPKPLADQHRRVLQAARARAHGRRVEHPREDLLPDCWVHWNTLKLYSVEPRCVCFKGVLRGEHLVAAGRRGFINV